MSHKRCQDVNFTTGLGTFIVKFGGNCFTAATVTESRISSQKLAWKTYMHAPQFDFTEKCERTLVRFKFCNFNSCVIPGYVTIQEKPCIMRWISI